jgi:hypothetical protein
MPDGPAAALDPNDHEAHEATLRVLYFRERRERERLEAELRHYRDSQGACAVVHKLADCCIAGWPNQ